MPLPILSLWLSLTLFLFAPFSALSSNTAPPIIVPDSSLQAPMAGALVGSMAPFLAASAPRLPEDAPRVGIQVGHWNPSEQAEELAHLRESYGTEADGYWEVTLNLQIAHRVATLLQAEGIQVQLVPARVPPHYRADAFVALHADGGPGAVEAGMRGFKLAAARSLESRQLAEQLRLSYAAATGLPEDDHITEAMTDYYAFNHRKFTHAVSATTPAVILEMGFLTSPEDRELLIEQPDQVAQAIAEGILLYLAETK